MAARPSQRLALQTAKEFLEPYSPAVQAIALRLRRRVFEAAPGAIEQVDAAAKLLGYGFDRTYKGSVCVIMPLKAAVNLGFARGAELPDPAGLLQGAGKRARHVKVADLQQADAPALGDLLAAAVKAARDAGSAPRDERV